MSEDRYEWRHERGCLGEQAWDIPEACSCIRRKVYFRAGYSDAEIAERRERGIGGGAPRGRDRKRTNGGAG